MNDFRNLDGWDEDEKLAMQRELAALRSDLNKCNNLSEIRRDAFYDEKSARWAMVDRVRELERENAALKIERNRVRVALQDIADASGFDNIGNWARNRAKDALRKEAQP